MHLVTKWLPVVVRVLLGLIFTVFGLNGFLHFLPQPPMSGPPAEFAGALMATGYLFPLMKAIEVAAGLALLSGRLVPLALTMLAPIVINIACFHFFLVHGGNGMSAFLIFAELYLAWSYRDAFRGLLNPNAKPVASGAPASDNAGKLAAAR